MLQRGNAPTQTHPRTSGLSAVSTSEFEINPTPLETIATRWRRPLVHIMMAWSDGKAGGPWPNPRLSDEEQRQGGLVEQAVGGAADDHLADAGVAVGTGNEQTAL